MNELEQLENINVDRLYKDVSDLIESAKVKVVSHVNTEFVILNWNIGNRIKNELLDNKKPEYGKKVIKNLSKRLMEKYNVSQYRVVEKKRELNLLDMRYVNKMKKIKKSI